MSVVKLADTARTHAQFLATVGVEGTRGLLSPRRRGRRECVQGHEQGPDRISLLVWAVWRELFAGGRVAAVGEGLEDFLRAVSVHIAPYSCTRRVNMQ
jgi:hypothetical protein